MFYEGLKSFSEYGKQKWSSSQRYEINSSIEGLVLGGLAGGMHVNHLQPEFSMMLHFL